MRVETIPLPRTAIVNQNSFERTVENLIAWPGQTFTLRFDYNPKMARWIWSMYHHEGEQMVSPKMPSVAHLGIDYSGWPYMLARFMAFQSEPTRVSPSNLGDTVKLVVWPGPVGGHFPSEANISQAEEDEILQRDTVLYPTP